MVILQIKVIFQIKVPKRVQIHMQMKVTKRKIHVYARLDYNFLSLIDEHWPCLVNLENFQSQIMI